MITTTTDLDTAALLEILPHRPPILMIERLHVSDDGFGAVGHKTISSDEPCYRDTEQTSSTAYPHALIVESLGQAAAALWLVRSRGLRRPAVGSPGVRSPGAQSDVLYFAKAEGVTFFEDVYPGDHLVHEVHFERDVGSTAFMSGRTLCEGRVVAVVDTIIAASR